MTPEELETLVRRGKRAKLVEALAPLGESQRKKLSKAAAALVLKDAGQDDYHRADLALLAVGPLSKIKRRDFWFARFDPGSQATVRRVLLDRRPPWLGDLVEHVVGREFSWLTFHSVRELVRAGACPRPESPGYARLMVSDLQYNGANPREYVPLRDQLLADPELLEHEVWRLFRQETQAFVWEWRPPDAEDGWESWLETLVRLAAEGHLDRDRLLDESLAGMWTTTNSSTLSGYKKFHTALKPSLDEVAARESAYRDLLSHKTSHVAGFGLSHIKRLTAKGRGEGGPILEALPAVLSLPQKSHGMNALAVARAVAATTPDVAPQAARVAAEGLVHAAADVQRAAVDLLAELGEAVPEDLHALAADLVDEVSPLVRAPLAALVGQRGPRHEGDPVTGVEPTTASGVEPTTAPGVGPTTAPGVEPDTAPGDEAGPLWQRIQALSGEQRARLGASADGPEELLVRMPGPLTADWRGLGRLTAERYLMPIASVDELVDAVSHAVEVVDSEDDVERILDGIARLCTDPPDGFAERTGPLLRRLETGGGGAQGLMVWGVPFSLRDLLLTWLTGRRIETEASQWFVGDKGPARFLGRRAAELRDRVAEGLALPLLAAPTHRGGWIDARELVERVRAYEHQSAAPMPADVTQALVRLSPHTRSEALEVAESLVAPGSHALRWALGADEPPPATDPLEWRIAAWRARSPTEDAPPGIVEPLGWPGGDRAARFTWQAGLEPDEASHAAFQPLALDPPYPIRDRDDPRESGWARLVETLVGAARGRREEYTVAGCPTVLMHEGVGDVTSHDAWLPRWLIRWMMSAAPLDTDGFCARAVTAATRRLDMEASTMEPVFPYAEPLFETDRELTSMAMLFLGLGLTAKDADLRATTVDLLVAVVDDGRAHPEPLARVLLELAESDSLKINRVAGSLSETARVSPLHELVVAEVIQRYLTGVGALPRGSHHLLELLYTCLEALGMGPGAELADRLAQVKGSSKTAKLARAVRELPAEGVGSAVRHARLATWSARVRRLEGDGGESGGRP